MAGWEGDGQMATSKWLRSLTEQEAITPPILGS